MSPAVRSVLEAVTAFAGAAVVSLVLTPVAIAAAVRFGVLDRPGAHKSHRTPTPYLGGVAIVLAVAVTIATAAAIRPDGDAFATLAGLLGIGVGMALIGLVDDLRGLPVAVRFGAQLAGAVGLWALGIRAEVSGSLALNLVVTVVWVVGITNALNLLDNMDALSASTATVGAGWFAILALLEGQVLAGALAAALAGGAAGFLRDNRPPARIYMGDAGSLFLGLMLAALGLLIEFDSLLAGAAVPILVLTVPVLDTTLVVAARLRHGISPFQGGRDHTSHRLVRVGLPVPVAVGLIAAAGFAHGWVALLVTRIDAVSAWLLMGLTAAFDLVLLALLAKVPVYGNSRGRDLVLTERPRGD